MGLRAFFRTLLRHVTGVSTPFGGVSLQPIPTKPSEKEIAGNVLSFLGDRRALHRYYSPIPENVLLGTVDDRRCVESVREIRDHLSARLLELSRDSFLFKSLEGIRAACRDFLTVCEAKETYDKLRPPIDLSSDASQRFRKALATLLSVASGHVIEIAQEYSISIEGDLGAGR
jgi:hypothetical protein